MFEVFHLAFLKAAALGFLVAAPVGPVGALCISRTLGAGPFVGLVTGLGAATVHAVWMLVAALGVAGLALQGSESRMGQVACLATAVLLTVMGARALSRPAPLIAAAAAAPTALICLSAYLSGMALAMVNPTTGVLFVTAIPAILPEGAQAPLQKLMLAAGTFVGSCAWWFILSGTTASLRARVTVSILSTINKTAGILLIGFAALLLLGLAPAPAESMVAPLSAPALAGPRANVDGDNQGQPNSGPTTARERHDARARERAWRESGR